MVNPSSERRRDDVTPLRFLTLPENRSAWLAVRRFAQHLTRSESTRRLPLLFLHGPSGTGKTHLGQTLVERVMAHRADFSSQTIPARELAQSSEAESLREFAETDLLIVEDFQHLAPEPAERIARLLDERQERGRCVVATARPGPAHLSDLPARLTSRLAGGLVVGLEPLGAASRKRLARALIDHRGLNVAPEVVDWLAARPGGGVRPLLGALAQLEALSRVCPAPLQLAALTAQIAEPEQSAESPFEAIARRVAERFRIDLKSLRGRVRHRSILWPRQVSMYLIRELTGLPLAQIGAYFGRDHTTILHACRKVEAALESDPALAGLLRELRAELPMAA